MESGESVVHLADYTGLAIGDVLELSSGQPNAEIIVVAKFGSIYLVSPTRNRHDTSAPIRRLVEGTGERYDQHARDANRQRDAHTASRTAGTETSDGQDLEGFESHGSWSPRERKHQFDRWKRKQRATKLQSRQMPAQPNLMISVKQPDNIELEQWPQLPNLRPYLQNTYASWRILTGGGDHAETYLRLAEQKCKGPERLFREQLEDCFCSDARFSLAEEKFGSEFQRKLPMPMQKDLAILSEERRIAGLPGLSGRQKFCWALRHCSKDDLRDQNAAGNAMQALRDAVRQCPPTRSAFKKLIQALDSNMTMESAAEITEAERLNLLEDMMSVIPDFTTQ